MLSALDKARRELTKVDAKLERAHKNYLKRWDNGSCTRAATTTYNANAGWYAEHRRSIKKEIRELESTK